MKTIILILTAFSITAPACAPDSPEELKAAAEEALQEKDYAGAAAYLEKALSGKPDDQELHYYAGQAYRMLLFDDGGKINDLNPFYAEKASEQFRQVIEIAPRYEGRKFVVGPYTKIQSIWGSLGMTYLCKSKIDLAVYAFKKGQSEGGFYPGLMEYNKNIMASCEPDAILFTNGDNDTYPMWFLQLVEGYRKDITVVNLNLLNVAWYIKQLKNGYPFGDNNISMERTDEDIDGLKTTKWDKTIMEIPVRDDPRNTGGKIQWTLKPTIKDQYIRVQDLMVLEILKTNDWTRPVYFSTTVSQVNKIGLDDFLAFEGLVLNLKLHKEKISAERLEKNCLEVYTYNGINDEHLQYIEELQKLFQNYRAGFMRLTAFYAEAGKKDEVKKILERMSNTLPENLLPYLIEQMKTDMEELRGVI